MNRKDQRRGAKGQRKGSVAAFMAATVLVVCPPLAAEVDLTGYWSPRIHEDHQYRWEGPKYGEYDGLPLTDEAYTVADAWDPLSYYHPENQCDSMGITMILRIPGNVHIYYESENALIIKSEIFGRTRTIYLDGRSREEGPHTWGGHSLGEWDGDRLRVVTTHMLPGGLHGGLRRNGVPTSADMVMTEYFLVHDDYLSTIQIVDDPQYLVEPLIRSISFRKLPDTTTLGPWECEVIEWPDGLGPGVG